jgi:triosephosphate isomerase (TIM)
MRTPFVCGNWKLHKTVAEATALVTELKNQLGAVRDVMVGVAPPFTALHPVAKRIEDSNLLLAAQNVYWEEKGAWTGEVAPAMLVDVGCRWVIIGHSERRQHFGETDATVAKRVKAALAAGLGVIGCVGETDRQRDAGETFAVVDTHLDGILAGAGGAGAPTDRLVIAYEPVWAIGTGRTATPAQAQEVHAHIRGRLREKVSAAAADAIRIQYGGSVKASNAEALLRETDIDGALVGGASLDAGEFVAIVKAARPS